MTKVELEKRIHELEEENNKLQKYYAKWYLLTQALGDIIDDRIMERSDLGTE